jgi:hypothetical protein
MEEFFQACLAFPTVAFSLLLGLVLVYWLFVMVGALDIDMFDIDADLDADVDADLEGDAEGGVFADILSRLDLTDIPLTVSTSLFAFFGWLSSYVAVELMGEVATGLVLGATLFCAAAIFSLLITSRFGRLLKPMFRTQPAPSRRSLIGRICEITTLQVDDSYGQAEIHDGAAGLLIQVRSSDAGRLQRGSRALVFGYDADNEVFQIKPLEEGSTEL